MAGRGRQAERGLSALGAKKNAAALAIAAAAALLPLPATTVERMYSTGVYPIWQSWVTYASNAIPIALFDLAALVLFGLWLVMAGLDLHRRGWRAVLRIAVRTAVWGAAVYLVFLASWGLNYRRVPLAEKLALDRGRVTAAAAQALAATAVARVNGLYRRAHDEGFPTTGVVDPRLASAFDAAQRELGSTRRAVPARAKHSWLDLYFRRAGVDGMTDPFFLETLTQSNLLPFERTFVTAHEWGHLAGYADEGEANLVGWVTCLRGDEAEQYSGWLFLYGELTATFTRRERGELFLRLDAGPRADVRAIADRVARDVSPRIAAAGWRVYDRYLKANRVESGTRSYTEVIRLILGTRFKP